MSILEKLKNVPILKKELEINQLENQHIGYLLLEPLLIDLSEGLKNIGRCIALYSNYTHNWQKKNQLVKIGIGIYLQGKYYEEILENCIIEIEKLEKKLDIPPLQLSYIKKED